MSFFFTKKSLLLLSNLIEFAFFISFIEESNAQSPVANFTCNHTAVCVGTSVTFTNVSSGSITTYSWNFGTGATPATANTVGPHNVTYSSTGAKTISLTVTGPGGSNTITKTNFVTVGFERIKIICSNLLNYPDNNNPTADSTARHPYYRTIAAATLPDIMVVEEMNSQTGVNWFLSNVLNSVSSGYAAGNFINGFDTDNGIFYKTSKFSFVANKRIFTDLRDINEFKLVHTLTGDTIRIYAVHLKASTGTTEEAQRAKEVDSLRKVTDALSSGSNFIVCGDFNIYKTSESAYQKLIFVNPSNEGNVVDPLPLSGTWNNAAFAIYHTQSTRIRSINMGSTGGLNDRFDMMLFSNAINTNGGMTYVANSTTAFGNDGNHYNDSINKPPNNAIAQSVADALELASDHLPLFANFDFELDNCLQPDIGVLALTSPPTPICANANQSLQVQIKNYGTTSVDFSSANTNVVLQVTNPSSVSKTFTKILNSGILSPGNTMLVNFDSTYNMSVGGNYIFNANTSLSNDGNVANDAMPANNITVNQNTSAAISPAGSVIICKGDSITLSASSGVHYTWSTAATTASVTASDSGYYSVTVTDQNGCAGISNIVHVTYKYFLVSGNIFSETMGNVTSTTTIAAQEASNGFDNVADTMSGSADVRNTLNSSGYATASGGANIFITNTVGKNFIISGINTLGFNNLTLSFGIHKNTNVSTGSDLLVQLSTDGINYSNVSFPVLGSSALWYYVTVIGVIPSVQNLSIQFKQNGTVTQYRIDDVLLSYSNNSPSISANSATTFCKNDSVMLFASTAVSYLWNNGVSTQNIFAKTTGNYSVKETSANGCTANSPALSVLSNYCSFSVVAKVFIEGFYIGNGLMNAVIDPTAHPLLCDTIEMKLAQPVAPYSILYSDRKPIATDGTIISNFNTLPLYDSYYIVIKSRNGIETWSKSPIVINAVSTAIDFTTATGNRTGNNVPLRIIISRP